MLGLASRVQTRCQPPLASLVRLPAARAEAVARVPVDQAARAAVDRQVVGAQRRHRAPQRRVERRDAALERRATPRRSRPFPPSRPRNTSSAAGSASARVPQVSAAIGVDHGIEPVERQQPRAPVHQRAERLGIVADVIGAVERRPGESDCRPDHAGLHRLEIGQHRIGKFAVNRIGLGRHVLGVEPGAQAALQIDQPDRARRAAPAICARAASPSPTRPPAPKPDPPSRRSRWCRRLRAAGCWCPAAPPPRSSRASRRACRSRSSIARKRS